MKVIISEIPADGVEFELTEKISSESINVLSPVHAFVRIDKKESEVIVKGVINCNVEQECSRCLNPLSMDIKSQINVVYHSDKDIIKEGHYELKSDELDTGFYKNDILDIDELLIEQLLLNIPMKPLCSPNCKGLCPKCGIDLNLTQCNCEISEINPQLALLKQLLKRKE